MAPPVSSSIKPSVLCAAVSLLLVGRGGPSAAGEGCWPCEEGLDGIFVMRCGGGGGGNPALGSLDGARCSTDGRAADTVLSIAGLLLSWLLGSLDGVRRSTDGRVADTVLSIAELLLS